MDIRWAKAEVTVAKPGFVVERLDLAECAPRCVFAFASSKTDLPLLANELAALRAPVIGCTTAGQIGASGFETGDVTLAAVLDEMDVQSFLIENLMDLEGSLDEMADEVVRSGALVGADQVFGLVLVDGMSRAEERLMAGLHRRFPTLPIAGGSAGDELAFEQTYVYFDGEFRTNAAVLHVIRTPRKVVPLRLQHHVPTMQRLVITGATPSNRTIHEINGMPAVEAYAQALGVPVAELDESMIAAHPLMLKVDDEYYVRSVRFCRTDEAMEMFCAIEQGVVLRLGRSVGIADTLETAFARACSVAGRPALVIGCDSVLAKLELHGDEAKRVGLFYAENHVIGFSSYGEQYNALHANQTFTGFLLGDAA